MAFLSYLISWGEGGGMSRFTLYLLLSPHNCIFELIVREEEDTYVKALCLHIVSLLSILLYTYT